MRKQYALVCGYGTDVNALRDYIAFVGKTINQFMINSILLSGGYTNKKSNPEQSEAEVMFGLLQEITENNVDLHTYNEPITLRESLVGFESFLNSQFNKLERDIPPTIHIFCSNTHINKIKMHLQFTSIPRQFIQFHGFDIFPSNKKEWIKQNLIALPLEFAAYFSKDIYSKLYKARLEKIKRS